MGTWGSGACVGIHAAKAPANIRLWASGQRVHAVQGRGRSLITHTGTWMCGSVTSVRFCGRSKLVTANHAPPTARACAPVHPCLNSNPPPLQMAAVHFFRGQACSLRPGAPPRPDAAMWAEQEEAEAGRLRDLLPRHRVRPSLAQVGCGVELRW